VGLDKHGRPQFRNLLFHRGEPSFIAFDLLYDRGKDLRDEQVLDRKAALRRRLVVYNFFGLSEGA
jgi:ATP-dependent DNA ligase